MIFNRIVHYILLLKNTCYYLFFSQFRKNILINGYFDWHCGKLAPYNWGDDLNFFLFREICRKDIVCYNKLLFNKLGIYKSNVLVIGSIIEALSNRKSIIWGSGAISGKLSLSNKCRPQKVLAVRGPLTRKYLLDQGISCPEIYGDPALLVKYVYSPHVQKKYKVGIIPHYVDLSNQYINDFINKNPEDAKLINIQKYIHWHDFIDEINECECILSSSLHGIIISDTYNIPNVWVEFSKSVVGDGFKFRDYYASVGKSVSSPVQVVNKIKLDTFRPYLNQWEPIRIDLKNLIDCCPFCNLNQLLKKKHMYSYE